MFYAFDYIFMPSHFEGLGLISVEAFWLKFLLRSFAPGLDETPLKIAIKISFKNNEELYSILKIHTANTIAIYKKKRIHIF